MSYIYKQQEHNCNKIVLQYNFSVFDFHQMIVLI